MSESTNTDTATSLIARYFDIESVTSGGGKLPFLMRYVGKLRVDSERAHRELSAALKSQRYTVLLLEENGQQIIQLMPGLAKLTRSNPWINLIFFILTVLSVLMAGTIYAYEGPEPQGTSELLRLIWNNLGLGVPFAVSLLAILLAHEFGHYLAGRYHKTAVTLPYFLPFPLSPFGTLGAFIQLKEPPRNKRVLLDIGIAGPLAGLVVAIPVLLIGLSLSKLDQFPQFVAAGDGFSLEGNSIIYLISKFLVFRQWLPSPVDYGGVAPIFYWVRYLFTSLPTPFGGTDVFLHPVAWAGWAGLLVTALNLIPAGQLDGGHILYSLLGKRADIILPIVLFGIGALGFFWSGWWLWVFLILFMGRTHAQPLDQITNLDNGRKLLAIFGLVIFIMVFIPVPLRIINGPYGAP
jgi:membrane-associated protease RseP (regulator of RpoE activity)